MPLLSAQACVLCEDMKVLALLQEAYRTAEGRISQELLRKHVLRVLRVWRNWYIFSDDLLNGLQVQMGGGSCALRPFAVVGDVVDRRTRKYSTHTFTRMFLQGLHLLFRQLNYITFACRPPSCGAAALVQLTSSWNRN